MQKNFNPNNISVVNGNYFALPYSVEDSKLALISVAWDVSNSYKPGTSNAPKRIIEASAQVDLFDLDFGNVYEDGIGTIEINEDIAVINNSARREAVKVISHLEEGGDESDIEISKSLEIVNLSCQEMNDYVYNSTLQQLNNGKLVGLVGGDHSTPLGYIKALSTKHESFGVLHIDAHADLRKSYEGFTYSHASIMYNVINEVEQVSNLVQVGIRDFCEDEFELINNSPKITTFFDNNIWKSQFEGKSWGAICDDIISKLPNKVYISFDIDGLEPSVCPNTGTPVAGGLTYQQAIYLITKLAKSDKQIIGFDVNEVGFNEDNDWDANVGARLIYKISCATLFNNK